VILISCDTLRPDHLGFYGFPLGTSPHLDQLAAESEVYESAWSTAPLTGPSLSALLTGRVPREVGLKDNRSLMSGEAVSLPEVLAQHAIRTAAVVSNWVLRKRAELPDAGVQQGFETFDDQMESVEKNRPELKERVARDTTDAALRWLGEHEAQQSFFLWVHYQDPHGPYTPPNDCLGPPRDAGPEPELEVGPDQRGRMALPKYQVVGDERAPELYRRRYEAEIRYFDRELGRLIDHLRSSGLLERALILFTADHGESLGEHGYYFSHGQHLHVELVHVPLLIHRPGSVPQRIRAPVSHLDLWPTVLSFLGIPPGETHGVDLLAGALPDDRILPQFLGRTWSVTQENYRMIVEAGKPPQLYDIARDPKEEVELSASQPDKVQDLERRHQAFMQGIGPTLPAARPKSDEQSQRELEALGYVGGDGED
jgi:arylsulfatase